MQTDTMIYSGSVTKLLFALLHSSNEEIILVSVHDVNVSVGQEVFVAEQDVVEEVVDVINTAKLITDAA
ncbi:hypothetical protein Tco_1028979 [Tanacetum coccineum]|uniref:Uncharacterized protein n=1 Tax=Tanacetum coccineum TaxID=301880 RepID=A0ABQ5G3D4_9ASTR